MNDGFSFPSQVHEWTTTIDLLGGNVEQVVEYEIDPDGDISFVAVRICKQLSGPPSIYHDQRGKAFYGHPPMLDQRMDDRFMTPAWKLEARKEIRRFWERLNGEAKIERLNAA